MCTCINIFKNNKYYFGRNMDIDYSFNEKIIIIPKNFKIKFKIEKEITNHYAFIGIGTIVNNYPLLAEGSNEFNLSIAALNFPLDCIYNDVNKELLNYAPYELTLIILSTCKDLDDVKKIISNLNVINIPFNDNVKLTPLHFMISFKDQSVVIEQTNDGLKLYDNVYHILTNSPSFYYHKNYLINYIQLHNSFLINNLNKDINFKDYSYGLGAFNLPGDYSSSSRFVKGYFIKNYLDLNSDDNYNIIQFFKCLDSISMIKNIVKTHIGYEYTRYTSCYNEGTLYYKTYLSNINYINMFDFELNNNSLYSFNLYEENKIRKD